MSYDFQSILVSDYDILISSVGSNSFIDPDLLDDSNTHDTLFTSGTECILISDDNLMLYLAFFFDSNKNRWLTPNQAINAGHNLETILDPEKGSISYDEIYYGPLPEKYLNLLVELNIAHALGVSIQEDELKSILI